MSKTTNFKYVGTSVLNGVTKVRYANSADRAKVMARGGQTKIRFMELEEAADEATCVDTLMRSPWIMMELAIVEAVAKEATRLGVHKSVTDKLLTLAQEVAHKDTFENEMDNKIAA